MNFDFDDFIELLAFVSIFLFPAIICFGLAYNFFVSVDEIEHIIRFSESLIIRPLVYLLGLICTGAGILLIRAGYVQIYW